MSLLPLVTHDPPSGFLLLQVAVPFAQTATPWRLCAGQLPEGPIERTWLDKHHFRGFIIFFLGFYQNWGDVNLVQT